jgi:hypothetical protein
LHYILTGAADTADGQKHVVGTKEVLRQHL